MRGALTLILVLTVCPLQGQNWSTLNKKGLSLYRKGEYTKAADFLSRAVAASSRAHGHQSKEHLTSLTNLAYVRQAQGDYKQAQKIFKEAFSISSVLYVEIHIDHVEATVNLANLFLLSGDYDSAEFYFDGARQQIFRAVQERSPHYLEKVHLFLDGLINLQAGLASLYFKKGQVDNAIAMLAQQRTFIRQTYPDEYRSSPVYRSTIHNLATYYLSKEDIANAEPIVKEQVSISEDLQKKDPTRYLQALNNLGNVYRYSNKPDSALIAWREALEIVNNGVAMGSDVHVSILTNMGELQLARDSTAQSVRYLSSAAAIQEKRGAINPRIYQATLLNLAEAFSWDGRMKQADQTHSKLTDLVIDEVLHHFTYLSDSEKISFYRDNSYILEHFSWFAFEVSGAMMKQPSGNRYTNPDALKRLFDLRLVTKGLILHPGYRLKNLINAGDKQISTAYKKWEEVKYAYATLRRADSVDVAKLSLLSQQAETLEKWLRTNSPEFRRGFVIERKTWNDVQAKLGPGEAAVELIRLANGMVYGALILTSSTTNGPVAAFVKGTEKLHLENQFYSQYANAINHGFADTISYRIYWKPIMEVIRKNMPAASLVKTIYLSADGIYHNINVNTLLESGGNEYVLDETDVRHVTNLKDIPEPNVHTDMSKSGMLVGRPQFSVAGPDRDLFTDLPGTELEVNGIEKMLSEKNWKTTLLLHAKAQESALKKIQSPTILHVATHGFFIDQSAGSDFTDILLNSGIALAGAEDGKADDGEDGILTAYEMMNMDLEGTKLVVLSACETGLGTFYSGEGVYGLQRAIRSAGAEAVIMSLWKVDDIATQQLMTAFYRLWLDQPEDPRSAFRKAQQQLKARYPEPRYWGAFVYME